MFPPGANFERKRPRHGDKKPRKEDREEKSRKRSTGATDFPVTKFTWPRAILQLCHGKELVLSFY